MENPPVQNGVEILTNQSGKIKKVYPDLQLIILEGMMHLMKFAAS
jgi:hypothetical protein